MPPLHLDEHCVVLPGDDVLHVFSRRGSFELKGKSIHRLHERLSPVLAGGFDEGELLARIPEAQRSAVQGYLSRLRSAGALRPAPGLDQRGTEGILDPEPAALLGASAPRLAFRDGAGREVRVSLDGPLFGGEPGGVRIAFAAPAEVGRMLMSSLRPGRLTCVCVDSDSDSDSEAGSDSGAEANARPAPGAEELEMRAVYARWLLHGEAGAGEDREADRVRVFRLHPDTGALERLAYVEEAGGPRGRLLLDQLGVVRLAEAEQLPLSVLTASHPFFAPSLTVLGTDAVALRHHLLRAFVGVCVLHPGAAALPFYAGELGAPRRAFRPVAVGAVRTAEMAVAGSLLDLHLEAVERLAEARTFSEALRWREADLLREPAEHPAVTQLQESLRLRRRELPARVARGEGGLWIYAAEGQRARSFLRVRALAQALAAAVRDEFHPGAAGSALASPPVRMAGAWALTPRGALRDVVRQRVEALRREGEVPRLSVARLRRWGITAWVGGTETEVGIESALGRTDGSMSTDGKRMVSGIPIMGIEIGTGTGTRDDAGALAWSRRR